MIIVTSQTFTFTMDDEDSYFPVLLHSIVRFAHLLSFTPHKSSFIFLSHFVKEVYTIHYYRYNSSSVGEEKKSIRGQTNSFSCSSPGIIITFHRETSHTHTRRTLSSRGISKLHTYFKHYDCFSTPRNTARRCKFISLRCGVSN